MPIRRMIRVIWRRRYTVGRMHPHYPLYGNATHKNVTSEQANERKEKRTQSTIKKIKHTTHRRLSAHPRHIVNEFGVALEYIHDDALVRCVHTAWDVSPRRHILCVRSFISQAAKCHLSSGAITLRHARTRRPNMNTYTYTHTIGCRLPPGEKGRWTRKESSDPISLRLGCRHYVSHLVRRTPQRYDTF